MPSSLESLREIKLKALRIKPYLEGRGEKSKRTYCEIVDRFYQKNEGMMAPLQYEAAKQGFEYFLRLLDLAIEYYRE